MLVKAIFSTIREINERGITVLLVEQNARAALRVADRADALETEKTIRFGSGEGLLRDERVR